MLGGGAGDCGRLSEQEARREQPRAYSTGSFRLATRPGAQRGRDLFTRGAAVKF